MSVPLWLTPAGDLGIIPEQEYYEFIFDAYNSTGGPLHYSLISGSPPAGLEIQNTGQLSGIPTGEVRGVPAAVSKITTSEFTVRTTNLEGAVADRTFQLTIAGFVPQEITPTSTNLGYYFDGTYVAVDINTIENNSLLTSTFRIIGGALPDGLSLNNLTGLISGYITPINTSTEYTITVEANNGVTIQTKIYTLFVYALVKFTADVTTITADNYSSITADADGEYGHVPVITTQAGAIATLRQGTRADVQIVGKDFEGDTLSYVLSSGTLPPGMSLNTSTGWITGIIPSGQLGQVTYTFTVRTYKTDYPDYISLPKTFTIDVLGQLSDVINWVSPSYLGSLNTGEISEFFVEATTPSNRLLNYYLTGSIGRLPFGIQLTTDGLLSGRASFDTFTLDSNFTTIDDGATTFDQTFTFTVTARDPGNYISSSKEFTIYINKTDTAPYENLYIAAYPSQDQRLLYDGIINNSDIFDTDALYRANDPWFGKNTLRRSLFLTGLNPETAETYINSMMLNHYWKTLNFGQIKTARALNDNFNVVYEVVYIELLDRQVNNKGVGPDLSVSLPANSRNISTIHPNSFPNMATRVETGVGFENRGVLPKWMTSRQVDGTVLGFTRALVICYTKPYRSSEIAYRVRTIQDTFKSIDFTIDRYEWDNSQSYSYNKATGAFIVNNFSYGSGTISTDANSNVVTGLTLTVVGSGTISGVLESPLITGTNTKFGSELRIGRPIYRADTLARLGSINAIQSSTALILDDPLDATISNIGYIAETSATKFTSEIYVNDTIVVGNTRIGTVKSINSDSSITLYANALITTSNVAYQHNARYPYSTPGQGDKYLKFPQVGVIS